MPFLGDFSNRKSDAFRMLAEIMGDRRHRNQFADERDRSQRQDALREVELLIKAGADPESAFQRLASLGIDLGYQPGVDRQVETTRGNTRLDLLNRPTEQLTGIEPVLRAMLVAGDTNLGQGTEGVALAGGYGGQPAATEAAEIASARRLDAGQAADEAFRREVYERERPLAAEKTGSEIAENLASAGASRALEADRRRGASPQNASRQAQITAINRELTALSEQERKILDELAGAEQGDMASNPQALKARLRNVRNQMDAWMTRGERLGLQRRTGTAPPPAPNPNTPATSGAAFPPEIQRRIDYIVRESGMSPEAVIAELRAAGEL